MAASKKSRSTLHTTSKKAPSARRKSARRKSSSPSKASIRAVWGIIFLIFAVIGGLSIFGANGFMINWYKTLACGLIGFGYYVLPICFLCGSVMFFIKKSTVLSRRIFTLMLLPLFFGAFMHVYMLPESSMLGADIIGGLFQGGTALQFGGILSGLLAIGLQTALSSIGACILIWIFNIIFACIAFNWDLIRFFQYCAEFFKEIHKLIFADINYEQDEVPEPVKKSPPKVNLQKKSVKRNIDIPLDDVAAGDKNNSDIKSPEQILAEITAQDNDMCAYEQTCKTAKYVPAESKSCHSNNTEPSDSSLPPWEENEIKSEKAENAATGADCDSSDADSIENDFIPLSEDSLNYDFPPLTLLEKPGGANRNSDSELTENSIRLLDTLKSFNIEASIINITHGPSVTRYELQLNRGTKYSKITALADDIALSLGAASVRIAPIPDKIAIGVEVPNKSVETVYIREVIDSPAFKNAKSKVTFAVGKDIAGTCIAGDISKMPHMLIAGTTGSGKSVCINSMLISLIYKSSPQEVRLIMIDPKMIELGCYNGIPHLLVPVVTDPKKAAGALNWAVAEMMHRYKLFSECNVRDLASYNAAQKSIENGQTLPQIVIVIDELADLMLVAAREVEEAICRVAQMARAAGMHLIIATQRPSADVITGLMKANIPSRIAFAVASQIESRIILDSTGAEKLIGRGDMLYAPLGAGKPQRVQGCLITSSEVEAVVEYIKQKSSAEYSDEVIEHIEKKAAEKDKDASSADMQDDDWDEMLDEAIKIVVESGQASVSYLQRKLKLGYSRAARIVDQMEEKGIVGPFEGSKPRAVLISKDDWMEMTLRKMD